MPVRKKGGVRAPLRFDQVVGAHDYARAGRRQCLHATPYLLSGCRIETCCGFIEEHETRRMQQRGSELKPACPATGKQPGRAVGPRHETELANGGLNLRARILQPVDLSTETEVLEHRELGVERQPLRHVTNPLANLCGVAPNVESEYMPTSAVRLQDPGKHAKGSGFAGAIGADEAADLARPQGQRPASACGGVAIAFRKVIDSHQQLSAAGRGGGHRRAPAGEIRHGDTGSRRT